MKKVFALLLSAMLFILPVLSFAEGPSLTTVTVHLNPAFIEALGSDEMTIVAALVDMFSLAFHTQENQIRAAVNMADTSLLDLVLEATENKFLIGSSVIGDTVLSLSLDDLQNLIGVENTSDGTDENGLSVDLGLDISFDHFSEVLMNSIVMDYVEVSEWEIQSDVPTACTTIELPADKVMDVVDALIEDLNNSNISEVASEKLGQSINLAEELSAVREEIPATLPESGNYLSLLLYTNDDGEIVSAALYLTYMDDVVVDFDVKEITNDEGETSFDFEEITEHLAKNVSVTAFRSTVEDIVNWQGEVLTSTETMDTIDYVGYGVNTTASGIALAVDIGNYESAETEEPSVYMTISFVANYNDNKGDLLLDFSMPSEDDVISLFSIDGTYDGTSDGFTFALNVNVMGYDDPVASFNIVNVPSDAEPSIDGKDEISLLNMTEEDIQKLTDAAESNLGSLLGAFLGSAE